MPIVDQRTPHLNLPLPYVGNTLADDVTRLREALTTLDVEVDDRATIADLLAVDSAAAGALEAHRTAGSAHGKAQVGLGNVDNTSDANKPISTATQTALDGLAAAIAGAAGSGNVAYTWSAGRLATATADGVTKTYAWHADGRLNTISYPKGGKTRTETYNWNAGDPQQLDGVTVTEI